MWKWLRSWFAWRFSLTRLVVAVVFLGAVLGLSLYPERINDGRAEQRNYGWPFACYSEWGPRTPNSFTVMASGVHPLFLGADVLVAVAGVFIILRLPLYRSTDGKAASTAGNPDSQGP